MAGSGYKLIKDLFGKDEKKRMETEQSRDTSAHWSTVNDRPSARTVETIQKDLGTARAQLITEKHSARQTAPKPKGDNSAYREARREVTAAQNKVDSLEKELTAATGVSGGERVSLTASGAARGMAASYAGAGGTALKSADMTWRAATDTEMLSKRGELEARRYDTRQSTRRGRESSGNSRASDAETRRLQSELRELTARKEAEALEKQLGLMKAASALDAEYERLAQKSASDIARAKRGAGAAGRFAIDAAVAGTQIASDAAANALVPGSSIVLKGVRSFGDASQEARKAGANVRQQVAYGGLTAGKDVTIEKIFDGLGGAYGKGLLDKEKGLSAFKEGSEAWVSTAIQPLLDGVYNGKTVKQNYHTSDVWADALRNAAIKGTASGVISAWSDAQNRVLDKAYDVAGSSQTQAALRKSYVGSSVYPNAESYAALIKALYSVKGDGHRW